VTAGLGPRVTPSGGSAVVRAAYDEPDEGSEMTERAPHLGVEDAREPDERGPGSIDVDDLERARRERRRRERFVSLLIAVAMAVGVVSSLRTLPEDPRAPVDRRSRGATVDLRGVLLDGSLEPVRARFRGRERGLAALMAGFPLDDAAGRIAAAGGYVQAERTVFERVGEPPLLDVSLETWVSEYDSPAAALVALRTFFATLHFDQGLVDPRPIVLDGADEGNVYVDRSIPRSVTYLWRHENLLLRVATTGNVPPSDVRPIAVAMDARVRAATR
jgi:hypothetical protein